VAAWRRLGGGQLGQGGTESARLSARATDWGELFLFIFI